MNDGMSSSPLPVTPAAGPGLHFVNLAQRYASSARPQEPVDAREPDTVGAADHV